MAGEADNSAIAASEPPGQELSNNPAIVAAVQAHLDAFDDIVTPDPVVEETPVAETPVETPAADKEIPAGETPTEEKPVEEAAAPVAPVKEPAEASTLPSAYIRSAKARGWTDSEITDFHKANPELSIRTFEKMHQSRAAEIQEWADLGRKIRNNGPTASAPAAAPASTPAPAAPPALAPIDINAMVEKYGNEEIVRALADPLNQVIASLSPVVASARAAQEQAQRQHQEALGKTIQDFFGSSDLKGYEAVYGPANFAAKTPEQQAAFSKVLEQADALVAGASFQGRQLSVQDALTLAHDSVSSDSKENVIREKIRTSVARRAASITLKPTAQGRAAQNGPPRNKQELVGRTEDRLAKAFG